MPLGPKRRAELPPLRALRTLTEVECIEQMLSGFNILFYGKFSIPLSAPDCTFCSRRSILP